MRGVSGKRNLNLVTLEAFKHSFGSEVILHISGTLDGFDVGVAFELFKYLTVGLSCNVGKNI